MGGGDSVAVIDLSSGVHTLSPLPLVLRILTHNIRYAATDLFDHEEPWPKRLPGIIRQLYHFTSLPFNPPSTIICLQEVLHEQLQDLDAVLSRDFRSETEPSAASSWIHVGVGRDDGKEQGEYNPIFYRSDFWEEVYVGTIWLSETPDKVSRGWDAGSNRLCTCLILAARDVASDSGFQKGSGTVMILNTHLDNAGSVARRKGAQLLIKHAWTLWHAYKPDHVLLTGDLNSTMGEKGGAWEILNAEGSGFVDSTRLLSIDSNRDVRAFGDQMTFTGFDGKGDEDEVAVLDFVHYGLQGRDSVDQARSKLHAYTVVPNLFDDDVRCSDHRAVVVDWLL